MFKKHVKKVVGAVFGVAFAILGAVYGPDAISQETKDKVVDLVSADVQGHLDGKVDDMSAESIGTASK
jgi:hypothetical protein